MPPNSAEGATTDATSTALLSQNVGHEDRPVRVIRSAKFKESKYSPVKGIRYDGMYYVVAKVPVNEDKHEYKFTLVRKPNQDPIRWQGIERRPTDDELAEFEKHKMLMKSTQ